jgi:ADP-ribosylglycohydrolase
MNYPQCPPLTHLADRVRLWSELKTEYGSAGIDSVLSGAEKSLRRAVAALEKLPVDHRLAACEPDSLSAIRRLRPSGPRRIWKNFDRNRYLDRLEGALLARLAGCTLGAIVEGWSVKEMEQWAKEIGDTFPPMDYWSKIKAPWHMRYGASMCEEYTRGAMNGVPVDDDIVFTLLGLLIAEDYGLNFTIDDVGKAWIKYLPIACTAEDVALKNLKKGITARKVAIYDNPYVQWIGADIRADPWAYLAPGLPEEAASMAYRDAFISHRRNGIYGEMFFAAAISAAFAVDYPIEALRIGLTEIPADCTLARDVRWALRAGRRIRNYREAREAVDKRFKGMSSVHTNNNACLTIFGLMIGGRDITKVISETVAMGLDNDCTAATAGSLAGAVTGKKGVDSHWYRNFNDTVHSYLINRKKFRISHLLKRFTTLAGKQLKLPAASCEESSSVRKKDCNRFAR